MNVSTVIQSSFKFELNKLTKPSQAVVYIVAGSTLQRAKLLKDIINQYAKPEAKASLLASNKRTLTFAGLQNSVWIIQSATDKSEQQGGLADDSEYAWFRDQAAAVLLQIKSTHASDFSVICHDSNDVTIRALIVGFELANYQFLQHYKNSLNISQKTGPNWNVLIAAYKKNKLQKIKADIITQAQVESAAVQLARHLVNLPPNDANPESIEKILLKEMNWPKSNIKVNVWHTDKLLKENMNLLWAVGKGSETPARLVHIQYRPQIKSKRKPVAFVGKGVTFDTGGLDIKPSSAMRLMKKDMGGAASVIGLAYWVAQSKYKHPCDFYLALAENSIDAASMRPSDVYQSRAGYLVEIDNTDAEGRLVLADAMDVAVKQTGLNEPDIIIDLATLTGAIKVALGAEVAGLFCNDHQLAGEIEKAGQAAGEPNWRMPLVQKYFSSMSSNFADFKNSADGFGGAITAALFLEKFCAGKKWVHLDIYAWADKASGPYASAGGNGQAVQTLIEWLKSRS